MGFKNEKWTKCVEMLAKGENPKKELKQ